MVPGVLETPCPPVPGHLQQISDELPGQRGRPVPGRAVPLQVLGVGVGVIMVTFQPAEQVPQVPLLGVGPALPVRREVGGEEPVQRPRVARR